MGRAREGNLCRAGGKGNFLIKSGHPRWVATWYSVRAQPVQLCDGGMQASFLVGKNASIGKSICEKTSQGFLAAAPPALGHSLLGMQ